MTCEKCGFKLPPNPIGPAIGAVGNALMMHFLNHMTPEPGFYANWLTNWWWFSAFLCAFSTVSFFVTCGIRLERRAHFHG